MVSQAGALALGGMLPAVHSFACFLTPRANEQVFNNATERTKVHLRRLPGRDRPRRPGPLAPVDPRHRADGQRARAWPAWSPPPRPRRARCVEWAVDEADRPRLPALRLGAVGARLRAAGRRRRCSPGAGTVVREDGDVVLVCTGPVLPRQAHGRGRARRRRRRDLAAVAARRRRRLAARASPAARRSSCSTTTVVRGGQGDAVRAALAGRGRRRLGRRPRARRAAPTTRSCARTASTRPRSPRGSERC